MTFVHNVVPWVPPKPMMACSSPRSYSAETIFAAPSAMTGAARSRSGFSSSFSSGTPPAAATSARGTFRAGGRAADHPRIDQDGLVAGALDLLAQELRFRALGVERRQHDDGFPAHFGPFLSTRKVTRHCA